MMRLVNGKIITMKKVFLWVLPLTACLYIVSCGLIYSFQNKLLFPSYQVKPVPIDWQPSAGDTQTQDHIQGRCGKLHVAKWDIDNAKGTIMMFHGNGESLASINDYVFAFNQLGYNLMAWDYPSYGQSTSCVFSQQDLLADAESAYQWLAKRERTENIYLFGYSIGTGLALSVAAKHQDNPVFLVAAYDSLEQVSVDNMPSFIPVRAILRYPLPAYDWAQQIKQPIYLLHGMDDQLIKPERVKQLVQRAHANTHLEWVEHAGHADDILFAYRNQWLKKLLP